MNCQCRNTWRFKNRIIKVLQLLADRLLWQCPNVQWYHKINLLWKASNAKRWVKALQLHHLALKLFINNTINTRLSPLDAIKQHRRLPNFLLDLFQVLKPIASPARISIYTHPYSLDIVASFQHWSELINLLLSVSHSGHQLLPFKKQCKRAFRFWNLDPVFVIHHALHIVRKELFVVSYLKFLVNILNCFLFLLLLLFHHFCLLLRLLLIKVLLHHGLIICVKFPSQVIIGLLSLRLLCLSIKCLQELAFFIWILFAYL